MKEKKNFSSESALVKSFVEFLKRGGLPPAVAIAGEVETGYGIADLVLYAIDKNPNLTLELLANVPPRYAVLLSSEVDLTTFSLPKFSELLGTSPSAANKVLRQLLAIGIVKHVENELFQISKHQHSPLGPIVSIEAKLNKWQQALRQAYRYKEFSHQSWVLLDHDSAAPAIKNVHRFVKSEVGLATFSIGRELFIHYTPPVRRPNSQAKYWAASVRLCQTNLQLKTRP